MSRWTWRRCHRHARERVRRRTQREQRTARRMHRLGRAGAVEDRPSSPDLERMSCNHGSGATRGGTVESRIATATRCPRIGSRLLVEPTAQPRCEPVKQDKRRVCALGRPLCGVSIRDHQDVLARAERRPGQWLGDPEGLGRHPKLTRELGGRIVANADIRPHPQRQLRELANLASQAGSRRSESGGRVSYASATGWPVRPRRLTRSG